MPSSDTQKNKILEPIVLTIAILALILFTAYVIDVLLIVFMGVLLAVPLSWFSEKIQSQWGMSRIFVVPLMVFILIVFFIALIAFLVPPVYEQAKSFAQDLPVAFAQLQEFLSRHSWGAPIAAWLEKPEQLLSLDALPFNEMIVKASGVFSSTLGVIVSPLIILLIAIYLSVEPRFYVEGTLELFPQHKRERIKQVLHRLGHTIRWWILGMSISMTILGLSTALMLWLLGVPHALLLAVITALMTFVPNFGPLIAGVPTVLVAFSEEPWKALVVLIFYTFLQNLEGSVITPIVQRNTISLPPALLLSAQLIFAVLLGVLGVVLAMPLLACVIVIVQMLYIEDFLGRK